MQGQKENRRTKKPPNNPDSSQCIALIRLVKAKSYYTIDTSKRVLRFYRTQSKGCKVGSMLPHYRPNSIE